MILALAGCNRGAQNKDAVRQGVLDYLSARTNLTVSSMNVEVKAVEYNGNQAVATVTFTPKGGNASQGMDMRYELEQQGTKWVVKGRKDSGQSPHGAVTAPGAPGMPGAGEMPGGAANPHGGMMPGGAGMPSAADLPPGNPAVGATPADGGKK